MTFNGPEPLEVLRSVVDYEHYLLHQLRPIAEAILSPIGGRFDILISQQAELF
jgi:DNA polymerase-2